MLVRLQLSDAGDSTHVAVPRHVGLSMGMLGDAQSRADGFAQSE